jgi:hypothetical protein
MALSLDSFCADMHRLGHLIEARSEMLPSCGTAERGGLHVELSTDGNRYVLTESEKDLTVVLIENADKDTVMECLFDKVTENMAPFIARDQMTITPADALSMPNMTGAEMRQAAISLQVRWSKAQEMLLGNINPAWRDRQAEKNAQRLKYIEDNFWP